MDHFKVFSYQKIQSYCFDIIQMSRQSFLSWMGLYVQPFWDVGGPAGGRRKMHRVTPEGLLAALLLKMNQNVSYKLLGFMLGTSPAYLRQMVTQLRDWIYQHSPWLNRLRNLGNPK